jgi:hypothetical protein
MFKRNKILTVVASSALITCSAVSTAQESVTSTATVTVQNAFDLTEVAPLTFGTLRASQNLQIDGGSGAETVSTEATYVVKSDGTANITTASVLSGGGANATSALSELTAGTPGEYSIANAAPFTNLTVSDPADFTLTNPSAPAASFFNVQIALSDMTVSGGGNDGDTVTGSNLLTDATGAVSLLVGGTIFIDDTATEVPDGAYTGTYVIQVDY